MTPAAKALVRPRNSSLNLPWFISAFQISAFYFIQMTPAAKAFVRFLNSSDNLPLFISVFLISTFLGP
jgi:hypothetical protein